MTYQTKHRKEILDLFTRTHVLTAVDIKEALPDVDTVTIYRTLRRLVDSGEIQEVKHSSKFASYELPSDHQHFVCTKCQQVFPVIVNKKQLAKAIHISGTVSGIHVDVEGVCVSCQKSTA